MRTRRTILTENEICELRQRELHLVKRTAVQFPHLARGVRTTSSPLVTMALTSCTRVGTYEILGPLGSGGMGDNSLCTSAIPWTFTAPI